MRKYRHAAAYVLGVIVVLVAVVLSTPGAGTGAAGLDQESSAVPARAAGRITAGPDPAGSPAVVPGPAAPGSSGHVDAPGARP